jgi:protein ImuB
MRRVLSLSLPAFAIETWQRRRPAETDRPRVLLLRDGNRLLLSAVDAAAAAVGLVPGLSLAEARALCPGLGTADWDAAGDARALARLADWAGRYSPWTAVDPCAEAGGAAGLWLDITGCAHLFGGEAALCRDLLARLAAVGLSARAGLADTPGAAWALARHGLERSQAGPRRAFRILAPGTVRDALAPLPLAALRLPPVEVELLARFGLVRIGDLLALPPAVLLPRVGPQVSRRLRQALGVEAEPLSPRRPPTAWCERLVFGEPIATAEDLARALDRLLAALCRRLEAAGQGARRLELTLYRVDASLRRYGLGTSRPLGNPDRLRRLFAPRLEALDPGFGVDAITLAAPRVEAVTARQLALTPARAGRAAPILTAVPDPEGAIAALLDRLTARLGPQALGRQQPRESHLPERAVSHVGPFAPLAEGDRPDGWPSRGQGRRPLRLLARPEPIEATAPLPDQPPRQFRWRRVLHRVARAEGPERIAAEWWQPEAELAEAPARDYFRVEDGDGRRFWLYRSEGRWFLQGLFG